MSAPLVMTCGEPAGIGPEIATAAWQALKDTRPFAWIGDPRHLPQGTPVAEIVSPQEAPAAAAHALPVLPHHFPNLAMPGTPDPANAQGVIDVIARAVGLAQSGAAGGVVTAPIHKKALKDGAGFAYPGHTEYLAALAGVKQAVMMLACDELRVVPVTIHMALSAVPGKLSKALLRDTIALTHRALIQDFGIAAPRLAVAGLNPHAGEGGAMGQEELTLIGPLLEEMRADGMTLLGPLSADTMFHAKARAGYDAAICMYHDQALIPIKTLAFDEGVNVTLGLPFVRTSPDHGTAFDIAGTGQANPASTIAALHLAGRLAARR